MLPILTILFATLIGLILLRIGRVFGSTIFIITALGVAFKILVGLVNSYAPLPGADVDAVSFENVAIDLAHSWNFSEGKFLEFTHRYAYANVLAVLVYFDGYHPLLFPIFNISLTVYATYNVLLTSSRIGIQRHQLKAISFILAAHPVIGLYSAVPMREAPIYFLTTLFFRILLNSKRAYRSLLNPALWLLTFALVYLHIGMSVIIIILLLYCADVNISFRKIFRVKFIFIALSIFIIFGAASQSTFIQSIPRVAKLLDAETGSADFSTIKEAQDLKSRGEGAYKYPDRVIGIDSIDIPLITIYMTIRLIFSPFFWEIRSGSMATLIKIIDLSILYYLHWQVIRKIMRSEITDQGAFLYFAYLVMAMAFGMNTVNDGVAMRHRAKFIWILLIASFSYRSMPEISKKDRT